MIYNFIVSNLTLIYLSFLLTGIFYKYINRHYYKNANNEIVSTILTESITAITIFLLIPLFKLDFSMAPKFWILLFISSFFYAAIDVLITITNKNLPIATTNLLWRSNIIYITLISVLIFHQYPTLNKIIALTLTLIGTLVLFYKKQKFKVSKYEFLALLAPLLYSIAIMIDVGISNQINLAFYAGLTLLIPSIILSFIFKVKPNDLVKEFKVNNKLLFYLTTTWALYILSNILAYREDKIINAIIISSISLIGVIILELMIDKERTNLKNKIIAMILIVMANIVNNL